MVISHIYLSIYFVLIDIFEQIRNMDVFYSIGLVQILFSIILIGKKNGLMLADKVLMILLGTFGLELAYSWLNLVYLTWLPDIVIIPYAIGPWIYLYTYMLTSEKSKLPNKYILHFIPFFTFLLIAIVFNQYFNQIAPPSIKSAHWGSLYIFNFIPLIVSFIYYWFLVFKLLSKHKLNVLQKFSFESDTLNLNWLKLLSAFVFWGLVLFITLDSVFYLIGGELFPASIVLDAGILITVYSISFFGFRQEAIFEEQQFIRFTSKDADLKTVHVKDTEPKAIDEIEQLLTYLKEHKPYLTRNLTLQDVANEMNMPAYRLSEIINTQLNKNFFTLINDMRIEEVKHRISSKTYENLTLSAIGFDSGFNSKSSFHSLFKKYTNMTPSQYKKSLEEEKI